MYEKNKNLLILTISLCTLIGCSSEINSSFTNSSSSSSSVSSSSESTSSSSNAPSSNTTSSISSSSSFSSEEKNTFSKDKLLEILSNSRLNQSKVKSGFVTDISYFTTTTNYEFGKDKYGDFIKTVDGYNNVKYYGLDANKNLYGIQESYGSVSSVYETVTNEFLLGPSVSFYGGNTYIHGVESVLNELITVVNENKNKDLEFGDYNEDFSTFDFTIGKAIQNQYSANYDLFVNNYVFTLENSTVKSLTININKYDYNSISADYEDDGVFFIKDDATPSTSKIEFTQEIGDRTLSNPYDIETLSYSSFDLKDSDGNLITDSFTFKAGVIAYLDVVNMLPETANGNIDKITVTKQSGTGSIYGYFSSGKISLNCSEAGEYVILIKSRKLTKTLNITVETPLPESISITSYTLEGKSYSSQLIDETNSLTTYKNSDVYFTASILPNKANQNYTCSLTETDNATLVTEDIKLNSWDSNLTTAYKFTASKTGDYTLIFASSELPNILQAIIIHVVENPSVSELLSKRYLNSSSTKIYQDVNFTPSASDIKNGTVKIDDILIDYDTYVETKRSTTLSYSYDEESKKFILTGENSSLFELYFSGSYRLILKINDNGSEVFVALNEFSIFSMLTNGIWSYFNDEYLSIEFETETSGTLFYNDDHISINYSLIQEGEKYIVDLDDATLYSLEREFEISVDEIYTNESFAVLHFKFTKGVDEEVFDYSLTKGRG